MDGDWRAVETRIWKKWSTSGSVAMDLLLERGRRAMQAGDLAGAVEHLTALTDHAPEFAEGWNARATAFFMMEEYALSLHDIEITLSLNPRHFGAMSGLGMIMERLERPREALRAYRGALAVHPNRPDLKKAVERLKDKVEGTEL
ncbi:MAG: tetratricopeptide repeat protein [Paracoccaceae bacterium]